MPSWIRSARLVRSAQAAADRQPPLFARFSIPWRVEHALLLRSSFGTGHRICVHQSNKVPAWARLYRIQATGIVKGGQDGLVTTRERCTSDELELEPLLWKITQDLPSLRSAEEPGASSSSKTALGDGECAEARRPDDVRTALQPDEGRSSPAHDGVTNTDPSSRPTENWVDIKFSRWAKQERGWRLSGWGSKSKVGCPSTWRRWIPTLLVRYGKGSTNSQRAESIPVLDTRVEKWVDEVMNTDAGEELSTMGRLAWDHRVSNLYVWTQVSLWCLTHDPPAIMKILTGGSAADRSIPPNMVRESLLLVALCDKYVRRNESVATLGTVATALCDLVMRAKGLQFAKKASIFNCIIDHCNKEAVIQVFKALVVSEAELTGHTFLQFASYFAKRDCFELGLQALQKAREKNVSLNETAFRSCCTTILRNSIAEPDGFQLGWRILNDLIQAGLEVDKPLRIVMMLHAVKAGEVNTAFTLFDSLIAERVIPDKHTIHILLLACQLDIDNVERLQKAINNAVHHVNVRGEPEVADIILQTLAMHHLKHNPATAFKTLADAFAEMFDTRPLQNMYLPWPGHAQNTQGAEGEVKTRMPPSSYAMVVMVRAYISHILLNEGSHDLHDLRRMHQRWQELAKTGEALYTQLTTTDHMTNAFLMGFTSKRDGLYDAVQVIRDKQQPLPSSAGDAIAQSPPTLRSWNILLHGFTRHGMTDPAEQTLSAMRAAGLEPDIVSWTTLVHGYTRLQDLPGTSDALLRLEQADIPWTGPTYNVVGMLTDQVGLKRDMDRARARRPDFSQELKDSLGERVRGAASYEVREGGEVPGS